MKKLLLVLLAVSWLAGCSSHRSKLKSPWNRRRRISRRTSCVPTLRGGTRMGS